MSAAESIASLKHSIDQISHNLSTITATVSTVSKSNICNGGSNDTIDAVAKEMREIDSRVSDLLLTVRE